MCVKKKKKKSSNQSFYFVLFEETQLSCFSSVIFRKAEVLGDEESVEEKQRGRGGREASGVDHQEIIRSNELSSFEVGLFCFQRVYV